jgi:ABC-2 type transport system permease protein
MKQLKNAFFSEVIKLRRSAIWWILLAVFMFIPTMIGLMMIVATHPEIAAKLGIVAAKSKLVATSDWTGYFTLLIQTVASIGFIGFGFVTSWVFGREFSEHTVKDILALPVSRTFIVTAKFILSILWSMFLISVFLVTSICVGRMVSIDGWDFHFILSQSGKFFITSILTLFLLPPVAFFASYGKGVVAPLGFIIFTLIMAQFAAILGFGPYFPWAIPGVYTALQGTPGMQLYFSSYSILILTGIIGYLATVRWWQYADHH